MQIVSPSEFDFTALAQLKTQKRKRGNQRTRQQTKYVDIVTAFDIETTRIPDIEQSIMYVWQWQFGNMCTVVGRTWDEFYNFALDLIETRDEEESIVVLVHNLSYEFQFLSGIYDFQPEEVFAVKSRRILKCTMFNKRIEFRCTYLHSNMSLSQYCKKMNVEHGKLSGAEFDYSKTRYPWTPLTDSELAYCQNDVLGLVEAYTTEMLKDCDNLYTVPLTSTGYVRREAKKAIRSTSYALHMVKDCSPDLDTYDLLRELFRGGDTHANRAYAGYIVQNVHSADRSSSYPDVMVNCKFPVTPFKREENSDYATLVDLIKRRKKAVIMRMAFTGIKLRDEFWGNPYIPTAKSRKVINGLYDNGRVLEADYLEISLTDIDLAIIVDTYTFADAVPLVLYSARYGNLPKPLTDLCIEYYRRKTELKGIDNPDVVYRYNKAKALLNALYGMMSQDPIKQTIDYKNHEYIERDEPPQELLDEYNKKAFLVYQWGCYVTAWARWRLYEGMKLAGDGFIYADTDSVKYVGSIDWTAYNNKRISDSKKSGAYATDINGVTHFMGVYEAEDDYNEFITLGAKKYAYKINGKVSVTIAGVNKQKGGKELEKHGGLDAFDDGFTFVEAGGTELIYNDFPPMTHIMVDGHKLPITSNVVIKESTYTMGVTAEYERILQDTTFWLRKSNIFCIDIEQQIKNLNKRKGVKLL